MVLIYDPLEDRRINDVTINSLHATVIMHILYTVL